MAARLEIALKQELFDAEGASLVSQARDYFRIDIGSARVVHILTIDADLDRSQLEAIESA